MKLPTDTDCRGQEEVVIKEVQNLANNGRLDDLIRRASTLDKNIIARGENVVYVEAEPSIDVPKSYFVGEPSVLFCGMTPIYYQELQCCPYDVLDRDAIEEIDDYIVFAGCNDVEGSISNRLFVMKNTVAAKEQLYRHKSQEHTKNVEMWLSGQREPTSIPELAPILEKADDLRKKLMAQSAAKKALAKAIGWQAI
jgi:hypothetical protein